MANYSLLSKSKNFRPLLFLTCLESFEQPLVHGRRVALALECVHTYSLIHDDLPCMDDDDMRRSQPSSHKKFGEAEAVLTGDALLTLSFELLSGEPSVVSGLLVAELSRAAGFAGMVAGQYLDIQEEGGSGDLKKLEAIHTKKTGALISASMSMAGIRAHLSSSEVEKLRQLGVSIGLIFQIRDDILDVTSKADVLGKTVGKDADQKKLTYPSIMGLDKSMRYLDELVQKNKSDLKLVGLDKSDLPHIFDYLKNRER